MSTASAIDLDTARARPPRTTPGPCPSVGPIATRDAGLMLTLIRIGLDHGDSPAEALREAMAIVEACRGAGRA
jgi:hypothetical protein